MKRVPVNPSMKQQQGAVLVVSLLLLLVITVLALGASSTTRMQERMSAGMRDRDLAFESSEAGLRNGERIIDSLVIAPSPCTSGRCQVYDRGVLPASMGFQAQTWWNSSAWSYITDETFNTTQHTASSGGLISGRGMAAADPQFVVEELEEVTDALSVPPTGPPPSRIYYRITAAAQGGTQQAQVVLQSTFARRF
jgi:type IV pilus assembly protein PilX